MKRAKKTNTDGTPRDLRSRKRKPEDEKSSAVDKKKKKK
jgi:hypothetical protein